MLDGAELKDITPPKRYTLLLCLVQRAQIGERTFFEGKFPLAKFSLRN